jgi:diguanylate cyclase (GGDEF)-like protein
MVQAWLAWLLILIGTGALHVGSALGLVDTAQLRWWTLVAVGYPALILLTIRSGANHLLSDPSLTLPQMVAGVVCTAWAYGITSSVHGATFLMLAVILMFGAFGLSVRQILVLGACVLALFGFVMVTMHERDRAHYPVNGETFHFVVLTGMVFGIVLLTVRLQTMRERLHRQKTELEAALAHIRRLATHDELTGLVNRRRMQELLENERLRSKRTNTSWCLALVDIDHFKHINDAHGHAIGDEALRALAHHAQALVRKTDVLGRWGGEEFVLMLPDTGLQMATTSVERLRTHFQSAPLRLHALTVTLSFSAGIAEHRPGDSIAQTLERADRLCYQAKTLGRNRVESG